MGVNCDIIDDNSSDEEIVDKSPENACLGYRSDSSSQCVPSSAPKETGSGSVISNYTRNKRRMLVHKGDRPLWKESLMT